MATVLETQRRLPAGRYYGSSLAEVAGVRAELLPDYLREELMPAQATAPVMALWHRVTPPQGMTVRLTSTCDQVRIVRLAVESETPHWNPRWPRWSFAVRRAPELIGGTAVDAQDVLAEDAGSLTLLVLPGETREATLEIHAALDGDTLPGRYACVIRVADITQGTAGEAGQLAGTVELEHPATALLDQLPSIYRDTLEHIEEPAEHQQLPFFLRFLRGFEDAQEPLERMVALLHHSFGPYSAPSDFLPWLSTWVGLALNDNWPEMRRRRLIAEAVELYRWRGTRKGLLRYLEIYAGVKPEINDQPFRGWRLGREALLGSNTVLGDVADHTFVVTLAVPDPSSINEQIVRDIIESEKPAHTGYSLRIVRRISVEEERAAL